MRLTRLIFKIGEMPFNDILENRRDFFNFQFWVFFITMVGVRHNEVSRA
jgi:hypothetical protein